jgi:hypothetical protein
VVAATAVAAIAPAVAATAAAVPATKLHSSRAQQQGTFGSLLFWR